MYKSINVSKNWVKDVSFTEFKKNFVIAQLEPKEQHDLYEKLSGKKIKFKGESE